MDRKNLFFQIIWGIILISSIFLLFELGPSITGFVVYTASDFIPAVASDELSNDQISPNGGTVDISDNTIQTIVYGTTNTYIVVTEWDKNVSEESSISNVILNVESGMVKA